MTRICRINAYKTSRIIFTVTASLVICILTTIPARADSHEISKEFSVKNETPQACYKEGVELFNNGRYWKAAKIWNETIEAHSQTMNSKQIKGLRMRIMAAYKELNNNPEAQTPIAQGRRNYDKGYASFQEGLQAIREKKSPIEIKELFNRTYYLLKDAENLGYLGENHNHIMAFACLHSEKLSTGWTYLDKSIKESPQSPQPLNLKATYLKKRKAKSKDVIDVLNRSLELKKDQKQVHLSLCRLYASIKQYAESFAHCQLATENDIPLAKSLINIYPKGHWRNEMNSHITNLSTKEAYRKNRELYEIKQAQLQKEREKNKK